MGQAKARKAEIESLKTLSTCKVAWADEQHDVIRVAQIDINYLLPMSKDDGLKMLWASMTGGLQTTDESKDMLIASSMANVVKHYHKLENGKCYVLQTATERTWFGPSTTMVMPASQFNQVFRNFV